MQAMLEDIQHCLDGMEDGAQRSTLTTNRREQQQIHPTDCDVQEDYKDNEEEQWLYTNVRKRTTQARNSTNNGKRLPHITLVRCHVKLTKDISPVVS